ncbi:hypothetical protein V8F20_008085 [Naviculisporaceae sp. PSN 640]
MPLTMRITRVIAKNCDIDQYNTVTTGSSYQGGVLSKLRGVHFVAANWPVGPTVPAEDVPRLLQVQSPTRPGPHVWQRLLGTTVENVEPAPRSKGRIGERMAKIFARSSWRSNVGLHYEHCMVYHVVLQEGVGYSGESGPPEDGSGVPGLRFNALQRFLSPGAENRGGPHMWDDGMLYAGAAESGGLSRSPISRFVGSWDTRTHRQASGKISTITAGLSKHLRNRARI